MSKIEYETYIENYKVKFRIGVQGFTLDYEGDDDELDDSLEWMREMLQRALDNLAKSETE